MERIFMYFYLRGKISDVLNDRIILEANNIGYDILVSRPENFLLGETRQVYIYEHIREDKSYFVGFDTLDEKHMFTLLLDVNGLGPRTALNMLKYALPEEIYNAILSNNSAFLKKIPGVGNKCASQIILDLHGKIAGKRGNPNMYDEVYATLRELGFKKNEIDRVLSEINMPDASNDEILKVALQKLGK